MSFKEVTPHPDFNQIEEEVLEFWSKENIFQKTMAKNPESRKFVFYEGPPTANGRPGIHHVLARAFKDIIIRFKTMQGFYVKRRAGWDTHGLPVEIEVEKEVGLKNKKEIEKFGVAQFNERCRQNVWRYKKEWEDLTRRIAFWLDLKDPYITYENSYIASVWAVLKQIWDKELIYKGYKVVPYCPRCGTPLSYHEVAQGYREIEEESVYIKIPIKGEKEKYFLVWTTTPWTLPGNTALAVNPDIDYVEAKVGAETLILAKSRLKILQNPEILKELKGRELEGQEYLPLYQDPDGKSIPEKDYRVWGASFVTAAEGTGIVHIAPAFGEDDMNLQREKCFSVLTTVDGEGKMLSRVANGKFVKDADEDIKKDLEERGLLFRREKIRHDYPFCWRCDSILIYYALDTWFIAMNKVRDKILENNEEINWIPAYLKHGRFGEWLREGRDWAISRSRFWGTPLPIWCHQIGKSETRNSKSETISNDKKSQCQNVIIIGSIEELKKLSTKPIEIEKLDLHKPFIDEIMIKCPECREEMQRIPDLLDVWFDSGAMPFAAGEFPDFYPADFISEAVDQTRGWFYTMLAIATLVDKGTPYKNVISLAHVLDDQGKKMSKSRGNVIDPWEVIQKFGADTTRWYFYTVNGPGEPKKVNLRSFELAQRQFVSLIWNVYAFFVTYAEMDGWDPKERTVSQKILDRWILSELDILSQKVAENLDQYEVVQAARAIQDFAGLLSTWYLRRSRKRRDPEFYATLYDVLMALVKVIAPFTPLLSEAIYQNLREKSDPESVHLCTWPEKSLADLSLSERMGLVRDLAEAAHALRAAKKIKVRQPLSRATIKEDLGPEFQDILKDEVNVKEIEIKPNQQAAVTLDFNLTPELEEEGLYREILRLIQDLRKRVGLKPGQKVKAAYQTDDKLAAVMEKFKKEIENNTAVELAQSQNLSGKTNAYTLNNHQIWLELSR